MSKLAAFLPKLAVFAVMAVLGAAVSTVVVTALKPHGPQSSAGLAPDYLLAGAPDTPGAGNLPVAFNEQPSGSPAPLSSLSPTDLSLAADALLGAAKPASFLNPSGFPRIPPITQFDGGPLANANCTMTAGAMLARLGYGIVTTGSTLRSLQDDQDGGTDLNDVNTALWRGYGITFPSGYLRPEQLKKLLQNGYGAVIQGDYSKIPRALRLQKDFLGGHAIYLDGYYPGNGKGIPEAYYVIDPLGRPGWGYEGDWWPASVVDAFGTAFGGGGHIPAMWAYPPGGVPPAVVGPDVLPIPPSHPGPSSSPGPTPAPGATPTPAPSVVIQPGDNPPVTPVGDPPVVHGGLGGVILIPILEICLIDPPPAGCPTGVEADFELAAPPVLQLPPGPTVNVVFVDSNLANVAMVGYTVDPAASSSVHFWKHEPSPGTVMTPSAMSSVNLFGTTVYLARLDVVAGTTYDFQVVAGSGLSVGQSPVGTFTTGNGVSQYDVALSQASSPVFKLTDGLSPYLHLAPDSYAVPMVKLGDLGGGSCDGSASFGGAQYCVDLAAGVPPPATCNRAEVTYTLTGSDADSVVIRAYPAQPGDLPDGGITLDGVLEATGPAPSGDVSVGCLASGLTYHIVIDAIGDDRGVLASKDVTVP